MKNLVFRMSEDDAAQYKSGLALDRLTMQEHLERHIKQYLKRLAARAQGAAELRAEPEVRQVTLDDHLAVLADPGIEVEP